jgi:hypothetical protein
MAIAKRKLAEPVRIDIKKEDTVKVITGRDKGKQGRVLSVNRDTGKILVERDPGIQCDAGLPGLPQGGAGGAPHRQYSRRQNQPHARLPQVRADARQEVRIRWQRV